MLCHALPFWGHKTRLCGLAGERKAVAGLAPAHKETLPIVKDASPKSRCHDKHWVVMSRMFCPHPR